MPLLRLVETVIATSSVVWMFAFLGWTGEQWARFIRSIAKACIIGGCS